jgi:CRISPR system Cascade subunit CasB
LNLNFNPDSNDSKTILSWHAALIHDRGGRAELKRARTVTEIIQSPAFHRLAFMLRPRSQFDSASLERVGVLAGLLAQVDSHDGRKRMAVQMATGKGGGPAVSDLRFRRLLQREWHELPDTMRRIIHMLGRKVNLLDLSRAVWYWGDAVKRDWAFTYFAATSETEKS